MTRITVFYLSTCGLLILGMWAVLHIGATLHAPPDLRGRWNLAWAEQPSPSLPQELSLAQSGIFLDARWGLTALSGRLERTGPSGGISAELKNADQQWQINLTDYTPGGLKSPATLTGRIKNLPHGLFIARQRDATAQSGATP